MDVNCKKYSYFLDISPCDSSPCEHGGSCIRQGITQNYVCNCVPGYTGNLCQTGM